MILQARSAAQAGPRLGAHMSTAGGLPRALDRAVATGCAAIQIFCKSSSQWRGRPLQAEETSHFRQRAVETGIGPNVAHASYLINLASPDAALRQRSVDALLDEMQRADALGLSGVVLHPGAYTTSNAEAGLARISDGIQEVFSRQTPGSAQLLLEHTAGQGTVLGYRFEHLRSVFDALDDSSRLGVCLDTCHLVAAGYDIISEEGYARVFDEFDAVVGLGRLRGFSSERFEEASRQSRRPPHAYRSGVHRSRAVRPTAARRSIPGSTDASRNTQGGHSLTVLNRAGPYGPSESRCTASASLTTSASNPDSTASDSHVAAVDRHHAGVCNKYVRVPSRSSSAKSPSRSSGLTRSVNPVMARCHDRLRLAVD